MMVLTVFSTFAEWRAVCLHNGQDTMACRIDRLMTERGLVVLRISGRITE